MCKCFYPLFSLLLLTAVACQVIATGQLDSLYHINGDSMSPALTSGTTLGIDQHAYTNSSPQRGDFVVFDHPRQNNDLVLLKRIIGLPGETKVFYYGADTL